MDERRRGRNQEWKTNVKRKKMRINRIADKVNTRCAEVEMYVLIRKRKKRTLDKKRRTQNLSSLQIEKEE